MCRVPRMETVAICFVGLLERALITIGVQYASFVSEETESGQMLVGLEIELPKQPASTIQKTIFLWKDRSTILEDDRQALAHQAIQGLQMIYGFTVVDFNYHKILFQQKLARFALAIATDALNFTRKIHPKNNFDNEKKYQYFLTEINNISKWL